MSLIRYGMDGDWEDIGSLYVYFSARRNLDGGVLTGLDGATEREFIEVVMRALDQSGELDADELEKCHEALRERLWVNDGE